MRILGSSWSLVPVVTLLTAGWGCIPIPDETTRAPFSFPAGLFAGSALAAPPLPCDLQILGEPQQLSEPDRFDGAGNLLDVGGDHTETIVLRAVVVPGFATASARDYVWSLDGVAAGQEETITVDITLGEHAIGLNAECMLVLPDGAEVTFRALARVCITLADSTTPLAVFRLEAQSFTDGVPVNDGTVGALRSDGIVHVVLDGTPSSGGLGSTIVRYVWGVDGAVIAFGPTATAALPIGEHSIQLLVENSAGESHLLDLTGIKIVKHMDVLQPRRIVEDDA